MRRLSVSYVVSLFAAFAIVGVANSLLYALNLGDYRYLSFMTGRAEAGFGEFQGRLLAVQAACFVPLSVLIGLPSVYLLDRYRRNGLRQLVCLGVALGGAVSIPLLLFEKKTSWGVLSLLLGVVWAIVFHHMNRTFLKETSDAVPAVIPQKTSPTTIAVCLSPLVFAVSLFLPAIDIDGRSEPLYGFQVSFFTFFFPARDLGEFLSCFFGVIANLAYVSAFSGFWLARLDSRSSDLPLKFAMISTASAILSPLPALGGRLDAMETGHFAWLCAHALLAAFLALDQRDVQRSGKKSPEANLDAY